MQVYISPFNFPLHVEQVNTALISQLFPPRTSTEATVVKENCLFRRPKTSSGSRLSVKAVEVISWKPEKRGRGRGRAVTAHWSVGPVAAVMWQEAVGGQR